MSPFRLRLGPVHEKEFLCGTREGCVEPVDIVGREHVVGHVALVNIYVRPLSALCLVAGNGIGILYLQGIVTRVLPYLLQAVGFQRHILIVFHNSVEEPLALFARKSRSLSHKTVGYGGYHYFIIVVIGKLKPHVGKVKTVELAQVSNPYHHGPVAVGNKRQRLTFGFTSVAVARAAVLESLFLGGSLFGPVVVVSHHHEHVARCQLFLTAQHHAAYAGVVGIGALVAARYHDGLVGAHFRVAAVKLLNEFAARHHAYVGKA